MMASFCLRISLLAISSMHESMRMREFLRDGYWQERFHISSSF